MSTGTTEVVRTGVAYDESGGPPRPLAEGTDIRPDPSREYLAGGDGYAPDGMPLLLPETIDDLTRDFGAWLYEAIDTDPQCFAAKQTLKLGITAGDITMVSTYPIGPGEEAPDADQTAAQEAVDFCQRLMDRIPNFKGKVIQLLDCVILGNKLAEKIYDEAESGPDAGYLVLSDIKVKGRKVWDFIVDGGLNVTAILARDYSGIPQRIPRDKFVIFTWMPRDDDPRGRSIYRAAYTAWNLKILLYPQYYKYLKQFGSASVNLELAPGEEHLTRQEVDRNGVATGRTITAQQFALQEVQKYQNGSAMVVPNGSTLHVHPPQGEGGAFLNAFDYLNREMLQGMLLQTRATSEAEHGSKADSETSQDVLGLLVAYGREMAGEALRQDLFHQCLALNFGQEYADLYTPYVYFGGTENQDRAPQWNAASNLMRSGYLSPSQMMEMDANLGLPVRDMEEDNRIKEENIKRFGLPQGEGNGGDEQDSGSEGDGVGGGEEKGVPGDDGED